MVTLAKHDLMGEQRSPFAGSGKVGGGATNQFVSAIGEFNELGGAEFLHYLPPTRLGNELI